MNGKKTGSRIKRKAEKEFTCLVFRDFFPFFFLKTGKQKTKNETEKSQKRKKEKQKRRGGAINLKKRKEKGKREKKT